MNYKPCVCNLCGTGCGQFLKTDGQKVLGVAPLIAHPVSKGKLCVRGWHVNELLNTSQRITSPLIRENGQLRKASYEEAIALVVSRMKNFDGKAGEIGVLSSARSSNEDNFTLRRLTESIFKTRVQGVGSEAGHGKSMASIEYAFGFPGAVGSLAAIDNAEYILIIGTDITRQNPIIGGNIHAAQRRGARVVTVRSSSTQIAKLSTKHYQQKPGNKGLFVNALAKALYAVRTVNRERPGRFDQLPGYKKYIDSLRSIASVALEKASGIRYEEIEQEARYLDQAKSVVILFSSGISGLDKSTIDAITNLALLTDKMQDENSAFIPVAGICNLQGTYDMGLSGEAGNSVFKRLAEPSPLRALFVIDHDDGVIQNKERIDALDFVVYTSAYQNPFMELADVVFPLPAFNECDGTYTASDRRVQLTKKNVDNSNNILPGWQLFQKIAEGYGDAWGFHDAESVFDEISKKVTGYADMSYQRLMRNFGLHWDPLAFHRAYKKQFHPVEIEYKSTPTSAEFPFALMLGKALYYWHQNNMMRKTLIPRREYDAMLRLFPNGYIEISPDDANALKVREKHKVVVVSSMGTQITLDVKISRDVQNNTAFVPYFIKNLLSDFLVGYGNAFAKGEESLIPVRIQRT